MAQLDKKTEIVNFLINIEFRTVDSNFLSAYDKKKDVFHYEELKNAILDMPNLDEYKKSLFYRHKLYVDKLRFKNIKVEDPVLFGGEGYILGNYILFNELSKSTYPIESIRSLYFHFKGNTLFSQFWTVEPFVNFSTTFWSNLYDYNPKLCQSFIDLKNDHSVKELEVFNKYYLMSDDMYNELVNFHKANSRNEDIIESDILKLILEKCSKGDKIVLSSLYF